jgi:hypothetical protein
MKHCTQPLGLGAAVVAITLCACTADPPPSAEARLPILQSTLHEMADLGKRGNRAQPFTYTLTPNCNLYASKLLNGQPTKQVVFALADTQFERFEYAPGLGYAIRTVNQSGGGDTVVFEASTLELIQSMLQLLERIKAECVGFSIVGEHGKPSH